MKVEQSEIDIVEEKLNKQNASKAALIGSCWCIPIFIAWYVVFQSYSQFAPAFMLLSGVFVGFVVRIHGKGYSPLFSVIAFTIHALIVAFGMLYNLILAPGESIWAIFLLGLYAVGAWLAIYIGRIQVPFAQHKAFFKLTEVDTHKSNLMLRNRWYLSLPIALILSTCLLLLSTMSFFVIDTISKANEELQKEQKQRDNFESKAIDVSHQHLSTLTSKEALLHTYAFYSGQLPNKHGYFTSTYPKSMYKAISILKYLSEERDHARAKYLLGVISSEANGPLLIRQAAEQGDNYARLHIATQYACNGNPEIATDMLNRLKRTTRDSKIRNKVDDVFDYGFSDACREIERRRFLIEYVLTAK